MRAREEKAIDPRFRLMPGQRWHQGARVSRPKVAQRNTRKPK